MHQRILNPLSRSQIKVVRRRVLQHDLDMFAAISGNRPDMPLPTAPTNEAVKVPTAASAKAWSASVLASYLRHMRVPRFARRAVRPEMGDWVRKLAIQVVERLHQAQTRMLSSHQPHRRATPSEPSN